jgi:glycosyltransferase involved in cell wall biosynthesis
MEKISTSVIIPTFNRSSRLSCTLDAISDSNIAYEKLEVVVVNDGSNDNTSDIRLKPYPFQLLYLEQSNQGDGLARNYGASLSQGDLLIFLDDDITVTTNLLTNMVKAHGGRKGVIVLGTLVDAATHYPNKVEREIVFDEPEEWNPVPFTECHSGLMAISQEDFIRLGMFDPLRIAGSSIWADVELAYRADHKGFNFIQSTQAVGYHHDKHSHNLEAKSRRAYTTARGAVLLFQRHPALINHLPMFQDKTPINWNQDPKKLIIRKMIRSLASNWLVIFMLKGLYYFPFSITGRMGSIKEALERWIIGGYIYRGYRRGLIERQRKV